MATLYIDCTNGISSDMLQMALRDLGAKGDASSLLPVTEEPEVHPHEHPAQSGRPSQHSHHTYIGIRQLVKDSRLSDRAKETVLSIYRIIAQAEGDVHGAPLEEVHFHEVGRREAVENLCGIAIALEELDITQILCSPIHDGCGTILCSHGEIPVPVPAVRAMMDRCDYIFVTEAEISTEMVTPSGLGALLGMGARCVEERPVPAHAREGHGVGTRDIGRDGLYVYRW